MIICPVGIFVSNPFPIKRIKVIESQITRVSFERRKDMRIKGLKRWSVGIVGIFALFFVSQALADKWSHRYIESLPDSAFASIEITKDGKKIRHLPHHNDTGEVDINHLKSALSRISGNICFILCITSIGRQVESPLY